MAGKVVAGIDVFCGAGGLAYGLRQAGIKIVAGIDLDPTCEFPFTANIGAPFMMKDVRVLKGKDLAKLYPKGAIRLLAGCAPCKPFSSLQRKAGKPEHEDWGLLGEFSRLVTELRPELVTMENVPNLVSKPMFIRFVSALEKSGYAVDYRSVYCPPLGIPQRRRRLVLIASRIGKVEVPKGKVKPDDFKTVRDAIGSLPALKAGEVDRKDRLHKARSVTDLNMKRLKASAAGGTWHDWPVALRSKCHQKEKGASFRSVYSRMEWDEPAPTITTQAYSFGTGRFGHPKQNRSLTLREAAILQSFPRRYRFVDARTRASFLSVGRLIGNAVPPRLARAIGKELKRVAAAHP